MLIETIRVRVDPEETDDLLEALSVRGLASRLVDEEGAVEVEVAPPEERWDTWNLEVVSALEAWLEQNERESVVARTNRHEYVVRAPRPLPARGTETPPVPAPSEADDTARVPAVEPVVPVGVLAEPQVHTRRPRAVVLAAGAATAILALAGIVLLVFVVANLL